MVLYKGDVREMSELENMLIRHEGIRLKPYIDSVGKTTIGVGRNLDDNGITKDEALFMLRNDIRYATVELFANYPWSYALDTKRQDALIDMVFNLGITRFGKFKKMIAAFEDKNYVVAAHEMLDSKWAAQVGARAKELANMVRHGED